VSGRAPAALERSEGSLRERAGRLGPAAVVQLDRRSEQVRGWRRLLAAYDVDRQLERGYSLTLRADGSLVRSAGDMAAGASIVTRLADGTVRSTVDSVEETGRVDVHGLGTSESTSGDGAP
jgi:exodeoxyribonuclease VII large subunit